MRKFRLSALAATLALLALPAARAMAGSILGDPVSIFFSLRHGGATIAQLPITFGPGGTLEDIRDISEDGDAADSAVIGSIPAGMGRSYPIVLRVVAEDDPAFKLLHFFITVPLSIFHLNNAGPISLFDPSNSSQIEASVTNAGFAGGAAVVPQLFNTGSFFTSFMRDKAGRFYESPQTNAFNSYGNGVNDIQVPGTAYLDGNTGQYNFAAMPGPVSSWSWTNIPNPGPATTIHNGQNSGQPSAANGHVFELGLTVAFTPVPEPTTFALLAPVLLIRRRRRS